MLKINNKKKIMIPILALILVVAMAGSALADYQWQYVFDINTAADFDQYQTILIQTVLTLTEWPDDYSTGGIDGIYGDDTEDAVEEFQEDMQLTKDGEVGSGTWQKLGPNYPYWDPYVTYWSRWDGSTYDYYKNFGSSLERIRHNTVNEEWDVYYYNTATWYTCN